MALLLLKLWQNDKIIHHEEHEGHEENSGIRLGDTKVWKVVRKRFIPLLLRALRELRGKNYFPSAVSWSG
jgi:hypothetical protein